MKTDDEIRQEFDAALGLGPKPGRFYRHYKGGIYGVLAIGLREEDGKPVVIYRSHETGVVWVRTLGSWLLPKFDRDSDSQVPRYRLIDPTSGG